jgi:hypothetical protein
MRKESTEWDTQEMDGGWDMHRLQKVPGVRWCGGVWEKTLNDNTTKGCGIVALEVVSIILEQGLSIM